MAATDAIPVPRKNAAFRLYFAIRKNDGTLITSWTGADSEESLDGGAFSDCTNEATEIGTSGCGYLDLTAAEMNADAVVVKITVTNTSALPLVFTLFPESAGDYRVADTQKVDVETIKTQALTAAAGITFPSSIASPTNITAATGVTLAAVTHTGAVIPTVTTVTNQLSAATISSQVASDLATAHGAGSWATATGFSTHSAADVWAVGTRTITGGSLTTAPPTAAAIADAVWDEARAGHATAGTFGFYLDAAISSISAGGGATAQQVWEYATRELTGAVELDPAGRLAIWNTLTTETFTADSFGELLLISDGTNGRAVKVTGANHIAADVHDCQADGLSGSTEIANIQDAAGWLLAIGSGAVANPQTATEQYDITQFGVNYRVAMAGLTSTGTRTAPTLSKPA